MALGWTDAAAVASLLRDRHPRVDPLTLRFPDLVRWVADLPGFTGPGKPEDPLLLEEIQRQWHRRCCA